MEEKNRGLVSEKREIDEFVRGAEREQRYEGVLKGVEKEIKNLREQN